MTRAAAAMALTAAVLAWPSRPRAATRLRRVRADTRPGGDPARHRVWWWWAAALAPALAVGGPHLLVGAVALAGVVAAASRRRRGAAPDRDLPLVVDLLGACLRAGAPPAAALRAAAAAGRGDTAGSCLRTAADLDAGTEPAAAWSAWSRSPELSAVAQVCLRVSMSGAAAADELARVAARIRAQQRADTARRAQRAGTWVVVPLGLCFLPAFVLVGVVPLGLGLVAAWR